MVPYPQIIHFNKVFHYKPFHFGVPPIFGNTHVVYFLTNPTLHRARSRVGVFPSAKAFPKTAKMERATDFLPMTTEKSLPPHWIDMY